MPKIDIKKFRYAGLLRGNPTIQEIELSGGLTTQLVNDSTKQEIPPEWLVEDYEGKHINPKWIDIQAMPRWMKMVLQKRWGVKLIHENSYKKAGTLVKVLSIDEVMKLLENRTYRGKKPRIQIDDMDISARRIVYHLEIGTDCAACGRKGKQYELWRSHGGTQLHLDLFSEDDMLMTIDHIKPKAFNGADHTKNFQMLCYECNQNKGCS